MLVDIHLGVREKKM